MILGTDVSVMSATHKEEFCEALADFLQGPYTHHQ